MRPPGGLISGCRVPGRRRRRAVVVLPFLEALRVLSFCYGGDKRKMVSFDLVIAQVDEFKEVVIRSQSLPVDKFSNNT